MRRGAVFHGAVLLGAAVLAAAVAAAADPPGGPGAPDPSHAAGTGSAPQGAGEPTDAGAAEPAQGAGAPQTGGSQGGGAEVTASCIENIPAGATRPVIIDKLPDRGLSGYAVALEITVKHGKGETVLPEGFRVAHASDAGRVLAAAGFVLPDQDGGSPATIVREEQGTQATTKLTIPFVPLPEEAGRHEMILPPVPIAVARASGEMLTVCTQPHPIRVEDPTANESDPKVKQNPPPRPQREDWEDARRVAVGVLIGLVIAGLALWAYRWWRRRPRVVKLPPPRLPWVVALEELAAIRRSNLLAEDKTDEYYDKVSDAVRKYLGARYGFDGLEATTDEMRSYLYRSRPPINGIDKILRFLEECDLVKFARVVPTDKDCIEALDRGEAIVHMTIPPLATAARKDAAPAAKGRPAAKDAEDDEEAE